MAPVPILPPLLDHPRVPAAIFRHPFRFDTLLQESETLGVATCAIFGPVEEINDPTAGLLTGMRVEVVAIEIGKQHIGVSWVALDEAGRFLGAQGEAHAEHNGTLEGSASVGSQPLRFTTDS